MPEKDPQTYSLLATLFMIGAALLGGMARWLQKFKDPAQKVVWTVMELLAHVTMALLSGGLAFVAADWFNLGLYATVGLISLSSYFGGESVETTKQIVLTVIRGRAGLPPVPADQPPKDPKP